MQNPQVLAPKEIGEATIFLADLGNAVDASLADNKIDAKDIPNFTSPALSVFSAVIGGDKIGVEFNDMTHEQREAWKQLARDRFDLADDDDEKDFEDMFTGFVDFASGFKNLISRRRERRQQSA